MKENPDIEELLNGFIDGELTARQETEVQRLISHDQQIAARLRELQKCKVLVSSLPRLHAPTEIAEEIKTSLERNALLSQQPKHTDYRRGEKHLFVRKLVAVAAMIGLVAVLGAVVYTIVAPEGVDQKTIIAHNGTPDTAITIANNAAFAAFNGRLELIIHSLAEVETSINQAIQRNAISRVSSIPTQQQKKVYTFDCSRNSLGLLLADLDDIWTQFESATFFVVGCDGDQVAVEKVTADQIAEIAGQTNPEQRIKVAKDFAVINSITENISSEDISTAIDDGQGNLLTPVKPKLTSGEGRTNNGAVETSDEDVIHMTIVLVGSE